MINCNLTLSLSDGSVKDINLELCIVNYMEVDISILKWGSEWFRMYDY